MNKFKIAGLKKKVVGLAIRRTAQRQCGTQVPVGLLSTGRTLFHREPSALLLRPLRWSV